MLSELIVTAGDCLVFNGVGRSSEVCVMAGLRIELFGRLQISGAGLRGNEGPSHAKALELVAYLLLHRSQTHSREALATLLWGNTATSLSRKYLRKAIWQLQAALKGNGSEQDCGLLKVEDEWLSVNPECTYWLDVAVFERCYSMVREQPGAALSAKAIAELRAVVALYKGGLLEGWYQDWCLFERERLQNQYFLMLDKLMLVCGIMQEYELGIEYGFELLRHDQANERTYRQLMRLYYQFGDRTAALHLYKRCVMMLKRELGVRPAQETLALYEQICQDRLEDPPQTPALPPPATSVAPQGTLLEGIRQLQQNLDHLLSQVQHGLGSSPEEQAE